ncbi:MAG TPA: mobile mystery protein B [bacterium]|nr:mobile mystery protein B [bacterium]
MIDLFAASDGQTPLTDEEKEGLIPPAIATRGDLNLMEEANIQEAREWAFRSGRSDILNDAFVRELHRRMFRDVWKWAGVYRKSIKNLGEPPEQIAVKVRELCTDVHWWVEKSIYPWDEAAARVHHRLVSIHPFSNGNGRHARLFTDLFLEKMGAAPASWGAAKADSDHEKTQDLRNRYISALRAADKGEYPLLVQFIRS